MLDPSIRRRTFRTADVELELLEAGEPGAPLILLAHGFPEGAYSWRHQLPALAAAGYHVIAPDQRGYGNSTRPAEVSAYGIRQLSGDLVALIDDAGAEQATIVGHDWGALIVWETARLHAARVNAVVGVSVPFVHWPGSPTALMKMVYGDRFFYMLYFQEVGPAETELDADPGRTMATVLWGASGGARDGMTLPTELPPMEGTGFLTMMPTPPALPYVGPEGPWLTAEDLAEYTERFTTSGFFGPVSYYRNLDANYEIVKDLTANDVTMPSFFIGGELDLVLTMDPSGLERMKLLPDHRGSVLIPGAGHWTQQEAPQAFNDALLGFLTSVG
jgi:pimeloyl-ACP methyl ester carboxylesterase